MKNLKTPIILLILSSMLWSCEETFLDVKNVEAGVTVEDMYQRYSYVQGIVWATYSYLPNGFDEMWREAATDVAEATSEGSSAQFFNQGNWNSIINPDNVWSHYFQGINQANSYLGNKGNVDLDHIMTSATETDSTNYYNAVNNVKFMEGEVLFLKAFFYFELVKRYGGVPILDEELSFEAEADWSNLERNSLDECIRYIVELCDQAAKIIPKSMSAYSWYEDGRVTYGAIKALKAKTLLYAASPFYKENGATTKWEDAAKALNDVISTGNYRLEKSYATLFGPNNASSREIIFKRRYGSINSVEYANFPIVFVGSNGNSYTPTQNFVDQFEVINNGVAEAFNWNNNKHAEAPYENRDPRMEATVVYNEKRFKTAYIETFIGGNSALPKQNATKTGYYLQKWINTGIDLVNGTASNHTWSYFRYGEIVLSYAEAMLNAYGPNGDPKGYGLTALEAFNQVRERAGMPTITANELTQNKIEHERLIELSFEDHRFWDVRRWKKGEAYFNQPITKVVITPNGNAFNYEVSALENRNFGSHMNWYPIPKDEIIKTGWEQNPGWD